MTGTEISHFNGQIEMSVEMVSSTLLNTDRDEATWGPKGAMALAGSKKKTMNRYKKLIGPH